MVKAFICDKNALRKKFRYFEENSTSKDPSGHQKIAVPESAFMVNKYYPFGLQNQNSWTRENATGNNFLYNEGSEINLLTGLYETMFRNCDPALGRFMQVDPLADKYSSQTSYAYANNDPVYYSDPLGAEGTSWSADFDEMYLGLDFNTRKTRASNDAKSAAASGGGNDGYNSSLTGVDFSFSAIHLSDIGFGFGDLYFDGRNILAAERGAQKAAAFVSRTFLHGAVVKPGTRYVWDPNAIPGTFDTSLRPGRPAQGGFVESKSQTRGGRIDLGNPDQKELFNQIMQGLYEGHRDGQTMYDVFDFTNAEKNFSISWANIYSAEFKINGNIIKFSLVKPIGPKDPLPIVLKQPENIYGTPNPSKYPTNVGNGTKTEFPLIYKFYDYDMGTVAQFNFHKTNAQAFSNFISYMNTGKPDYLFK